MTDDLSICNTEPHVLGIDEAGRGPVLGPMVYAAAVYPKSMLQQLAVLGVHDSKQLTEANRDALRKKIDDAPFLHTFVCVLSAEELSEKMLRRQKYNLNLISHDTALQLVQRALDENLNVTEVYVDTVGAPGAYANKFRQAFSSLDKVVVEKKADANHRIVGAASIVAKTTRDRQIKEWVFPEETRSEQLRNTRHTISPDGDEDDHSASSGDPYSNQVLTFTGDRGSGYPSDPSTKQWIKQNCDSIFGFPSFVRFSWGTAKLLMASNCVEVDWESDEEEEDPAPQQKKPKVKTKDIKQFFTAKPKSANGDRLAKPRKIAATPVPKLMQSSLVKPATKLF